MALTLEAIWAFRNRLVHPGPEVSILATVKELEFQIAEHVGALGPGCSANTQSSALWRPPDPGFIKVNVDASVSSLGSVLSAVARFDSRQVVRAWTKPSIFTDPLVAEAYACLWGLQLALEEKF